MGERKESKKSGCPPPIHGRESKNSPNSEDETVSWSIFQFLETFYPTIFRFGDKVKTITKIFSLAIHVS